MKAIVRVFCWDNIVFVQTQITRNGSIKAWLEIVNWKFLGHEVLFKIELAAYSSAEQSVLESADPRIVVQRVIIINTRLVQCRIY